ncbi:MAG: Hsp33 family molecular chaperone HslO [Desulfamplus sp.]|nr:Hsp33 family molecular chaperone HslO [Desulfamplus sp.]
MIKKDIYNGDPKARLKASAQDRLFRFIFADGMMRGGVVKATQIVQEMRANHELGPIETLILGQAYIAGILLTFNLKGRDRIALQTQCSGPVKGLDVEANALGEVRGYLKNSIFSRELPPDATDIPSMFGAGFITVTRYLEDAKTPYSGKVMMEYGTMAQDLAGYFVQSEQTPTAFSLGIHFDSRGNVKGAGGMVVQAMPGASDDIASRTEKIISSVPSIGEEFARGEKPDTFILKHFHGMNPLLLGNHRVEFFCRCTQKAMERYLSRLPGEDIRDLAQNGPFPVELRCHNCNTHYTFEQSYFETLLS